MRAYNYKKNKTKNKFYLFLLGIVVLFCLCFYIFKNNMSTILSYISYPYIYISDFFNNFSSNKKIIEENNELLKENLNLKIELEKQQIEQEEINTLKNLLDLKNVYTNYDLINATVISKNKDYFFNYIIIDKGKDYGILKDSAVVSSNGLIGKVEEVMDKTSLVKLITSDSKISIKIVEDVKIYYGMILEYKDNNLFLEIEDISLIKEESDVYTTGYGVFPEGIYVGKIKKDNDLLYVAIEDLNNLKYVLVLGNKIND